MPAAADAKFWMWNNYVIEEDWDFGFVEVSTDGGTTWTEQKVYDEAGTEVTTTDGYADPNGRMADYGGKKYGLTGATDGWRARLRRPRRRTPARPSRCACATPPTRRSRSAAGSPTTSRSPAAARPTWTDDVEGGDERLDRRGGHLRPTPPAPAGVIDTGTSRKAQYYLVEWRNFDGFDKGLKYAYDTTYQATRAVEGREDQVQRPGCAGLVPRHVVRQRQPRRSTT